MRQLLCVIGLAFGLCAGAFAGDLEDGVDVYMRGDYATALAKFKGLAAQGHANAQYFLGRMYYEGKGVAQDYKQALDWYAKAAEQGDASAQSNLGIMYDNGQGVVQDYVQAVYWYAKAAAQGYAYAQFSLGVMYYEGKGVAQDYKQALDWYAKAAEQGWLASPHIYLGRMYYEGKGVAQDYKQAAHWYGKAAEQGLASAQYFLGRMYYEGKGVAQDYKQALDWYAKAAEQGDAYAQYFLGRMYANGQGVAKDYKQALDWYAKAAEQGDAYAQSNLGVMYETGQGVVQDYVQAHTWYNLAASQGLDIARKNRDIIEQRMTPQQIAEAQRLAREWKPRSAVAQGAPSERPSPAPSTPSPSKLASSGTGFYISADGHVLTNAHVVDECSSLAVESIGKPAVEARLVASDARNDLAVIQTKGRARRTAAFRAGSVRQGESVVVYGFPLSGAIASTGNATAGNVSALAGLRDDTRMLQISAPVQPGNSGGPLMDMTGAVVGVVVGKLNAAKVMEVTGDIPQNINFAIKAHVARGFLESHGVEYETAPKAKDLSVADVADAARAFSVRVLCYR